jgi:hypothetical protein
LLKVDLKGEIFGAFFEFIWLTVGTETLGQTCFFLRSSMFFSPK